MQFVEVDIIFEVKWGDVLSRRGASSRRGPNIHFQKSSYAVTRAAGKRWIRRRRARIDVSADRDDVGAKRRSCVCIDPPRRAASEAPLACLRYGSRVPLSDVLCRTI